MQAAGPTYVECPRDAWQGLPHVLPTPVKVAHLQSLLDAGFRHLDLGSFVSPRAVPQMADTE
ncbi:MAG TPA: hydroxymethylglutaryl-CoA lyase, partial [Trueperaceae bacterium]